MKKLILLLFVSSLILVFACKKKDSTGDPTPFSYASLAASDSVVVVNSVIRIVAAASGDDLQYTWVSTDMDGNNYGTIIGSGNDVQWSVCHNSKFKVTCTIADKYDHSDSKTVYIRSTL
jgi:hypothetical protein